MSRRLGKLFLQGGTVVDGGHLLGDTATIEVDLSTGTIGDKKLASIVLVDDLYVHVTVDVHAIVGHGYVGKVVFIHLPWLLGDAVGQDGESLLDAVNGFLVGT